MKLNRSTEKEMKNMSIDRFHYGEGWQKKKIIHAEL